LRHFHERKLIALYVCGRETSHANMLESTRK